MVTPLVPPSPSHPPPPSPPPPPPPAVVPRAARLLLRLLLLHLALHPAQARSLPLSPPHPAPYLHFHHLQSPRPPHTSLTDGSEGEGGEGDYHHPPHAPPNHREEGEEGIHSPPHTPLTYEGEGGDELEEKEKEEGDVHHNTQQQQQQHNSHNESLEDVPWDDDPLEITEDMEVWSGNVSARGGVEGEEWGKDTELWVLMVKGFVMGTIILVAVLGNILVIVSVSLHRRLHSPANYLLVSLATADMLVALCAMTFNASVELTGGRWLFGRLMCDLWNSFDVYFSTVSILHLCCISVDRYYAIVRPLEYPLTITRRILTVMLGHCWLAPTLISFLPILLGWYTTAEHISSREAHPYTCSFVVNSVFALVSSAVSFWVPCTVMVVMYTRIFQEARKQERALLSRASSANSAAYNASRRAAAQQQHQQYLLQQEQLQSQQVAGPVSSTRQQLVVALQTGPATSASRQQEFLMKTFSDTSSVTSLATTSSGRPSMGASCCSSSRSSSGGAVVAGVAAGNGAGASSAGKLGPNGTSGGQGWRHGRLGNSWHGPTRHSNHPCGRRLNSTPLSTTKTSPLAVGRREHKAARTLGLIMGAFVVCWLPFFVWYVSITVCGPSCSCPHAVVTALFWIGYFNSTLNPFIYAYFRSDFREAFHRTLKRLRCCHPRQPAGVFV
ncbi:hypothetical protein Pmani_019179 [Petrolisthes manimaculis]|uniref:G-protein coupled receptors family 1 profile domain-containing protein n=1 Tax=Petrolisthes manimaculis TaxID=1843537 RepID=A0AAE1PIP3_9EUCA|nr:hypothetical protein Pmani_019179 [Petrolisthes manimaculis]